MPDTSIVKKKRLTGGVATSIVVSGNSQKSLVKKKKKKDSKLEDDLETKSINPSRNQPTHVDREDDDDEEDEDYAKPDIAIRVPDTFDLEDPDGIVNRTKAIMVQLDAERKANPLSEDTTIMYYFYRAALAETLELIPKAKKAYMRYQSQSNAFAFNGLVTKCQELIADIQALDDKGGALERILDQTIVPSFSGIIANLGNSYTMSVSRARSIHGLSDKQLSAVEDILKDLAMQTAKYVQETKTSLDVTLRGQLNEDY